MPAEVIPAADNFAQLGLSEPLMRALNALGYEQRTPIQVKTIPLLLAGQVLSCAVLVRHILQRARIMSERKSPSSDGVRPGRLGIRRSVGALVYASCRARNSPSVRRSRTASARARRANIFTPSSG